MKLPFFKPKPKTALREYVYALEITHNSVKSAVWTIANNKPHVVAVGKSVAWDDNSESDLISASDQTISECTSRFDPSGHVQPEKVILGLPSDWVSSEKIATNYLHKLKHVSEKLSLTAVGFVVIPEAIARHLQSLEGAAPTAILISVSEHHIETSIVKQGKVVGTQLVKRSSQVALDVIEGLSRFPNLDMLPSRMLLYGPVERLDEVRQVLLSHAWQSPQTRLPFLHFPKIENLDPDFSIQAVALAGGSEVAQAIGLLSPSEVAQDEVVTNSHETKSAHPPLPTVSNMEDLGFISDADISEVAEVEPVEVEKNQVSQSITTTPQDSVVVSPVKSQIPIYEDYPIQEETSSPKQKIVLPRLSVPSFLKSAPIFILLVILVLGSILGIGYWYLPKATITLTLESKTLEDQFDLLADTSISSLDISRPAVPAIQKEVTIDETATVPATGTKLIGDKATGTVTIINGTPVSKKFPKGTILTSSDNLKFLLDADVEVASASGSADPNSYQPGKTDVKVTASVIGTSSNLSAGTQFKVGSFSSLDFVARNEAALTGGSSRQVKAVSKDDYAKLRTQVTETAKQKAKDDLLSQIDSSLYLVNESIRLTVVSEDFNHKIDDTAEEVTLKLTVKAQGIVLNKSDIESLAKDKVSPRIPENFSLTGNIQYETGFKSFEKNQANLSINTKANLLPNLDTATLTTNLVGKRSTPAFEYLQNLPGVTQVDIAFWPPLPSAIRTLPRVEGNIKFEVLTR